MKNQKGITLVALVITIIVMLILSAVTINLTLGERGIFNVAQQAAKNYTDAAGKEETDLNNFQNEINNTLNGLSSGVVTKPEEPKQEWGDITATNYGDYVNYPVANGSTSKGHKTDWRIFYKDDDGYVYLIASYLLPYSQVPSGTDLQPYSGRPYTSYWKSAPTSITNVSADTYTRYKMGFTGRNTTNMYCVSQLMNISVWSKFVNTTYAIDAIGAPTLEMWVESWNAKSTATSAGWTTLTTSVPNEIGYNVNGNTYVPNLPTTDTLYFPITGGNYNDATGFNYWLASPSSSNDIYIMNAGYDGYVEHGGGVNYSDIRVEYESVRPIVRLKNTISAEKGADGVWNLK